MSNVSLMVSFLTEDVLEEGVADQLTKGWGTSVKATVVGNASLSKVEKNFERWQGLKKDLLENIAKHKDVVIDQNAFSSKASKLFNWRAIFLLHSKYYSLITTSIKNNKMGELTNFDMEARDIYKLFGNPKKVSDLTKVVNAFDNNMKTLVALEKKHDAPATVRAILAGAIGDFALAVNRLIHAST